MLWLLEFTREQHRYRAELRSRPAEPRAENESQGFWYVSLDGEPPRLAFEADVRDEDNEEFRARIVAAARGGRIDRGQTRSADV